MSPSKVSSTEMISGISNVDPALIIIEKVRALNSDWLMLVPAVM